MRNLYPRPRSACSRLKCLAVRHPHGGLGFLMALALACMDTKGASPMVITRGPGRTVELSQPSQSQSYYILQRFTDLRTLPTGVALGVGTGGLVQLTDKAPPPEMAFYRVQEFPLASPGDVDGDGVDDLTEFRKGPDGDPFLGVDSDHDGRSDLQERREGTDPAKADPPAPWMLRESGRFSTSLKFSLAVDQAGTLWSWGSNGSGQLGLGWPMYLPPAILVSTNAPVSLNPGHRWLTADAGKEHSLAIASDGSLWSWGDNVFGQLGYRLPKWTTTPIIVDNSSKWLRVAAGDQHSLGLRVDGTLWAWGDNDHGQLGDATFEPSSIPKKAGIPGATWKAIAAGDFHSHAIRTDGTLWSWGANDSGQLGSGLPVSPSARSAEPSQVHPGWRWIAVAAGYHHVLAIRSDGTLWSWGDNIAGQLGVGTTDNHNTPVQVGTREDWFDVAAGGYHSVGITRSGELFTWGNNDHGELGNGKVSFKKTPQPVVGGGVWKSIAAGTTSNIAVREDGTLWSWGENDAGQLGRPTDPNLPGSGVFSTLPYAVGTGRSW